MMNMISGVSIENIGSQKKPLYVLKGVIELHDWDGYFLYDEFQRLKEEKVVTKGRVEIWVENNFVDPGELSCSDEQVSAYSHLMTNQQKMKSAIIKELIAEFPRLLKEDYASWEHNSENFPAPSLVTKDFDFKNYIGPASLRIMQDSKDSISYITWSFKCRWDIEHGFEVITHKERIIDLALNTDIFKIDMDNGTYNEKKLSEHKSLLPSVQKQKPWWKFW